MRSATIANHQQLRSLTKWDGVPYHYLPIITGRSNPRKKRLVELFGKVDAELLVLARYMQILTIDACRYILNRAINGVRRASRNGNQTLVLRQGR